MKIRFIVHQPQYGNIFLELRNGYGVSVCISSMYGTPSSKRLTPAQRNLICLAADVFNKYSLPFSGDLSKHNGLQTICRPYTVVRIENDAVGDIQLCESVYHIFRHGKYLKCDQWFDV